MARKKAEPAAAATVTVVGLTQGIALLREALGEGDWEKVAQSFFLLTGENVAAPRNFDKEAFLNGVVGNIVDFLRGFSGGAVAPVPQTAFAPAPVPHAPHTPATPSPANEFVDDGSVAPELIQDSRASSRPKQRRPPFRMLDLTCGRCGRTQSVHPSLRPVQMESDDDPSAFTCDRCVGRRD
jgi:hypothetical protein